MNKLLPLLVVAVFVANVPVSAQPPQGMGSAQQSTDTAPSSDASPSTAAAPSSGTNPSTDTAPSSGASPSTAAAPSSGTNPSTDTAPSSGASPSTATAPSPDASAGKSTGAVSQAKKATIPFPIYVDQGAKDNHYTPSGWMGDYGDIKINPGWADNPHSGKNSFKVTYSGKSTNNAGWAGIFWQNPANNWGDKPGGGFNLTGATKLTFWARGEKGGEKIAEFKVGGITGEYPDSDQASLGPVELTKEWKQYTIDLKGKDLSAIVGAFAWAASKDDNPEGFSIYLDDIRFE